VPHPNHAAPLALALFCIVCLELVTWRYFSTSVAALPWDPLPTAFAKCFKLPHSNLRSREYARTLPCSMPPFNYNRNPLCPRQPRRRSFHLSPGLNSVATFATSTTLSLYDNEHRSRFPAFSPVFTSRPVCCVSRPCHPCCRSKTLSRGWTACLPTSICLMTSTSRKEAEYCSACASPYSFGARPSSRRQCSSSRYNLQFGAVRLRQLRAKKASLTFMRARA
jgi:hypothetical protein